MEEGHRRVIIERVQPEIDGGRFPIKRTVGEKVVVEADVFADGHDLIRSVLLHRREGATAWSEVSMRPLGNDRWQGEFTVDEIGRYQYTLRAWVDRFGSWRRDLVKKAEAKQDVSVDFLMGVEIIRAARRHAAASDADRLERWPDRLAKEKSQASKLELLWEEELDRLMAQYSDPEIGTTYSRELSVVVDRERARCSAWYEMFPRSCTASELRHGTFKDCEERLPYVAEMGFDVLYIPPIHPIGRTHRKGKNNKPVAGPEDVGSPWAIGAPEGGHKAIEPSLGTLEDFRGLVAKAADYGIEIALDIAFQCSPDHPYVKEHPEWFRRRSDGSVQYAENPPKKYEDIYPFDFETDAWWELWQELKSVVEFWIEQGVRIFRVDNPHTKPFGFWEWLIGEVKRDHPDVIFLSEAFTRPKVMYYLAKVGFTQSYTYFPWRNTKWEITQYATELTQAEVREYFRPNHWPNTPDILNAYLQHGGRPAFMARLILAATLSANYGIYGPAFELCENRAREIGSEEYLDAEKYQIRVWDIDRPDSLNDFIARVNRIRRENPALQYDTGLKFHPVDNDQLVCYSKQTPDHSNLMIMVVNLDPHYTQSGWVELPLEELGISAERPCQVHDLLSDARYLWHGPRNYVEINPRVVPAHIFRVRHRVRTEQDFEYYM